MRIARVIHCVDAHAEGEPSRIVVGGVLDVPGTTMLEKMRSLEADDRLRRVLLFEPRGSAPLSADVVFPSAVADAGFVIMESSSYEGMSGTNTLNTALVLLETGMIEMVEPVTELTLEAPAGLVKVRAECADGRVERMTFENVPSFALHLGRAGRGAGRSGRCTSTWPTAARSARSWTRRRWASPSCPTRRGRSRTWASRSGRTSTSSWRSRTRSSPRSGICRFVVFVAPPRVGGDARHATIVSPGRLDRAPTGTATSARVAVLSARGEMGDAYVAESVIDTKFTGRVVGRTQRRDAGRGRPVDHRPRVDHRLPPAGRRLHRSARRGLQALRHLGRRDDRGRPQRGLTVAVAASAPGAVSVSV